MASMELHDEDPVNPETWEWLEQGKGGKQQIQSDACPKSLDVRFIRVASHAKDVIKHV